MFFDGMAFVTKAMWRFTQPVPQPQEDPLLYHERFQAALTATGMPRDGYVASTPEQQAWMTVRAADNAFAEQVERLRESLADLRDVKGRAIRRIFRETGRLLDATEPE